VISSSFARTLAMMEGARVEAGDLRLLFDVLGTSSSPGRSAAAGVFGDSIRPCEAAPAGGNNLEEDEGAAPLPAAMPLATPVLLLLEEAAGKTESEVLPGIGLGVGLLVASIRVNDEKLASNDAFESELAGSPGSSSASAGRSPAAPRAVAAGDVGVRHGDAVEEAHSALEWKESEEAWDASRSRFSHAEKSSLAKSSLAKSPLEREREKSSLARSRSRFSHAEKSSLALKSSLRDSERRSELTEDNAGFVIAEFIGGDELQPIVPPFPFPCPSLCGETHPCTCNC
jgi:hypothetical protein